MQSSNLKAYREMRESYGTEYERVAFDAGYSNAHGIACHNVPKIGVRVCRVFEGHVIPKDYKEAKELHESICFDAEMYSRCFSPWEFVAAEINSLGEIESEMAWEAYDEGVAAAISHDLEDYTEKDYT